MRLLVLAAALDVRVELRGYELKGVGDFAKVGAGVRRVRQRQRRRDPRRLRRHVRLAVRRRARSGPSGSRTTPRSARPRRTRSPRSWPRCPGPGCTRWWCSSDEIQELFLFGKTGKAAGETAEKCIKLFRALGILLILGTQIPDKDSLPTGITRNINTRFCLSVADQVANDMILGTSAYKLGYRATVFEPVTEAGWGILAGMGKPGARRSFYVDNDQAAEVMARAIDACAARPGCCPPPPAAPGPARLPTCSPTSPPSGPPGKTPPGTRPCWNAWRSLRPGRLRPVGARPAHRRAVRLRHHGPGRSAAGSTARPSTGAARPAPTSSPPSPNVTGTGAAANRPAGASASAFPR